MLKLNPFFSRDSYTKEQIALSVWMALALFTIIQSLITQRYNNYLIFENAVRNLIHHQSLYAYYPEYHFDTNHYGPLFSVFFIPFAILPNWLGFLIWNVFNTFLLFKAIQTIPVKNRIPFYYIAIPCLISSLLSQQFNTSVAALIIFSYTLLNKNKGLWSTLFIMLGTFIKLYGIVGLAFFFFVKDKKRFILFSILWAILFFVLPMLFSSPTYIINSYKEWAISLIDKNANNILESSLDISIMGFIRTLFVNHAIPNVFFLGIGVLIFGLPYLNFKSYTTQRFQLLILGSTLFFPVLFSTGAEDCTYIISIVGVGIWYVLTEKKQWKAYLLGITIVLSCDFPLLLFPKIAGQYPVLLTMMSLPFFITWLALIYDACKVKRAPEFT